MLRCIPLRLALPVILAATLFSAIATAQSQNPPSVAEAARRAREQKKAQAKPAKVITEETLDVRKGDVQTAAAEQDRIPGSPEPQPQIAGSAANPPGAKDDKAAKEKELAAVKAMIKDMQSDIDLLQREQSLEQDTYLSNPDYSRDTAGKAKLDSLKQEAIDKQQELDRLKARLAELLAKQDSSPATPPKP
jgi:lipopolysaccharide export LptBFGC system permease protein LptF